MGRTECSRECWPVSPQPGVQGFGETLLYRRALAVLLLVLSGCAPKTTVVPAAGKVLRDDKPLAHVPVQFNPLDEKLLPANGVTDANGAFTLSTYPHGEGAMAGKYKVFFTVYPQSTDVPVAYRDASSTPLEVEIPAGGLTDIVLTVK
jgi:hypothetical protein